MNILSPSTGTICPNIFAFISEDLSTLQQVYNYVEKSFPQFLEAVHSSGWKTDVCLLGADEWRLDDQSKLSGMKTL